MKRKPKDFLGHSMTRKDQRALVSLVNLTTLVAGMPKKRIKSEAEFWSVVDAMFGRKPQPNESFTDAIHRIKAAILAIPSAERALKRDAYLASIGCTPPAHPHVLPDLTQAKAQRPYLPKAAKKAKPTPSADRRADFYLSWEWRRLRMQVLKEHGRRCMCCGALPTDKAMHGGKVRIVVDHIKPISKHWNLRLERSNLQVLCDECNMGKGAWDETDYRHESLDDTEQTDPLTRQFRETMGGIQ